MLKSGVGLGIRIKSFSVMLKSVVGLELESTVGV